MLAKSSNNMHHQKNLFYGSLFDILDVNDSIIALADAIDWDRFEKEFASYYSDEEDQLNLLD
jgi:hypothetical protein